ncbi:MAG: nitrous oxide reductase family maturation protein NosD [Candidatus Hodarchaeota archaeon]
MAKKPLAYHFILLFIIILAFANFIPNSALLSQMVNGTIVTGSSPPSSGNWDISSDTVIEDERYIINGSIRILSGANLTLNNVTLWMNCTSDGEYNITVYDGGELYIHNCTITAYNTYFSWYLTAKSGSLVLLNESTFSYAGYTHGSYGSFSGLHFGTDDAMVLNCTIHHNYYGLSFSGGLSLSGINYCTIKNNSISHSSKYGLYLSNFRNSTISENIVTNSLLDGIYLNSAYNNTLSGNTVTNSSEYGIRLASADNNTLSGNIVTNSSNFGIFLKTSENNTLSGNTVTRSSLDGIRLEQSNSSTLSGNTITNSGQNGILHNTCENTTFSGNIVTSSWKGISLSFSKNCTLSTNRITQCDWDGISLWSSNSLTVFNNTVTYSSEVGIDLENSGGCLIWGNMLAFNHISANDDNGTNSWDNGTYGNWWDDYIGPDWNHDGIGDIPYNISSSSGPILSQDRFPLMNITDNDDPMLSTPNDIEYTEGDMG